MLQRTGDKNTTERKVNWNEKGVRWERKVKWSDKAKSISNIAANNWADLTMCFFFVLSFLNVIFRSHFLFQSCAEYRPSYSSNWRICRIDHLRSLTSDYIKGNWALGVDICVYADSCICFQLHSSIENKVESAIRLPSHSFRHIKWSWPTLLNHEKVVIRAVFPRENNIRKASIYTNTQFIIYLCCLLLSARSTAFCFGSEHAIYSYWFLVEKCWYFVLVELNKFHAYK